MKRILLACLLTASLIPPLALSQKPDFRREFNLTLLVHRDTISALAGEYVTLSDPEWDWRTPPTCTILVYRRDRTIRPDDQMCNTLYGVNSNNNYTVYSRVRFDTADTLTVLRILEGQGRDRRMYRYGDEWQIHVRWPSLHSLVNREYWYGESAVFSFAAGHEDYSGYSYDIESRNRVLYSEQGSTIRIERIWRTLPPAELNSTITIKGKHKGKTFKYFDPATKQVSESVWNIELKSPSRIEDVALWAVDSTYDRLKAANRMDLLPPIPLNINQEGKYNPREFRFSSYAVSRMSFFMFMPDVWDVTVTSAPSQFLSRVEWRADDPWRVLVIVPNEDFLRDRSVRNAPEVSLRIRFRDQFGTSFSRVYKARVYQAQ
ncbi:MAG: hypothetical protein KF749_12205 [Bacteroidetes bacterium]|nr:hypothetical protein [Bacteroidota bacterium]MCW5895337.1 hypothetical protein [Bacteroidota bacterium]